MDERHFLARLLLTIAFLVGMTLPVFVSGATASADADSSAGLDHRAAVLRVANRDIVTFRSPVGRMSPQQRADAASQRLDALTEPELGDPVTNRSINVADQHGMVVFVGDTPLFALIPADLDHLSPRSLEEEAAIAARNLSGALAAMREQRHPRTLARGVALSLAATVAFSLVAWLILRFKARISGALEHAARRPLDWLVVRGIDMTTQAMAILQRITGFVVWLLILSAAYLWITFVLRRFPYTEPWGDALAGDLLRLFRNLGAKAVAAAPDVMTVIVIFTIAYLITQLVKLIFQAVEEEKMAMPFMYADTARPTRWLITGAIWVFAIVVAYPYIPGSDSIAFQGISVIAGLMATLGSAGIVNQAMSGLILLYSRALTQGEMVKIGDTEGMVSSVGLLSTKLETYRNEEVTLPNTVVIAAEIKNYSRLAKEKGSTIATTVSIGYDKSWRQVSAMLTEAARRTSGIRQDIVPRVMQRELADFYVKYELVASMERPENRSAVLNELLGNIQDEFNKYGVQIMSPNFEAQPDEKIIVPKDQWFVPPVEPDSGKAAGNPGDQMPGVQQENRSRLGA